MDGRDDRKERDPGDPEPDDEDHFEDPRPDETVLLPIESVLDLHSFLPSEVESVVVEYLRAAQEAGFDQIRIVHGRGIGVQREIVRSVLARTPFVISFRDAGPESGGWGATVALLGRSLD